jgi:hypothetical protein
LITNISICIFDADDFSIDFGRIPQWNCPEPEQDPAISGNAPKPVMVMVPSKELSPQPTVPTVGHQSSSSSPQPSSSVVVSPLTREDTSNGSPKGHPQPSVSDSGTSHLNPTAWRIPPIPCYEPEDRIFYAQIGPSGRKDVFQAITGNSILALNLLAEYVSMMKV